MSSFSRETEFTKFVSDEIARARSRHHSRRRRIPMPASSRHRARCNRHEARAGIVALISCCLVRLSNGRLCPPMRLSHFQRARGEVSSEPPGPAVQRRWARPQQSSNGSSLPIFHATQRTGPTDNPPPTAKDIISARISSPARVAIVPLLDWLPACVAHDFCNPEDPTRLATTPHSFL